MFVQSLNELIDLHTKRLTTALEYRVPASILVMLGAVSMLSMGVLGYHFGLAGSRNFTPSLILVLVFSAVLLLIIELDRPQQRHVSISKQALLDLQTSLNAPRPSSATDSSIMMRGHRPRGLYRLAPTTRIATFGGIVCQIDYALAMPSIDCCRYMSPTPFQRYNC